MDFLNSYFSDTSDGHLSVSAEQGSGFAKEVAGDFNPIHNAGSKRFCVPGDLLFALALQKYGLYQSMSFRFLDLVSADSRLNYPELLMLSEGVLVRNQLGKDVLGMQCSGQVEREPSKIAQVLKNYVAFSGQNFPHILVPLMRQENVMINTARPLVIYQSMSFELDSLDFAELSINLEQTRLDVDGKRGNAQLSFSFSHQNEEIGRGTKNLVLSGLREYDDEVMQALCDDYLASQTATA